MSRPWHPNLSQGGSPYPDYGIVGYMSRGGGPGRPPDSVERFPPWRTGAPTAAGCWFRMLNGADASKSLVIERGFGQCFKIAPEWRERGGSIDLVYWHWGALMMEHAPKKLRDLAVRWTTELESALAKGQETGDVCGVGGSWPPIGVWGKTGGRVYATATAILALEAPLRWIRSEKLSKTLLRAEDMRLAKLLFNSKTGAWRHARALELVDAGATAFSDGAANTFLKSHNDRFRELGAKIALGDPKSHTPELLKLLLRKGSANCALAARSLAKVVSSKRVLKALLRATTKSKTELVRVEAALSYISLTGDRTPVADVLKAAAKSEDKSVRSALLRE